MSDDPERLSWWNDPRVASERRNVFLIAILLALGACVIAVLSIIADREVPPPSQILQIPSPIAPPAPASPQATRDPIWSEKVTGFIVAGDLESGTRTLDEVELELCRLRGIIAHRNGDQNNALVWLTRAVSSPLATSGDDINLATTLLLQGRSEEAIAHFEAARVKEPDNDYAANRYHLALLQTPRADRAKQDIRSAIAAAPITGLLQAGIPAAVIELRDGNTTKAAELLAATTSLMPPETFQALLSEPELAEFSSLPELKKFFDVRGPIAEPTPIR